MFVIADFAKISQRQFVKDWSECFPFEDEATTINRYDFIKLPKRATTWSAGYDFYSPTSFCLSPGETIKIPTGIRCSIDEGWVLMLFPRSGLGFKYRLRLDNTVGIIDSDYYFADNEGHIYIKLTNCGTKPVDIYQGDAIVQGVFLQYGITNNDYTDAVRTGGFGSTDKNK